MILSASRFKKRARIASVTMAVVFFLLLVVGGRLRPVAVVREVLLRLSSPVAGAGSRWGVLFTGIPAERVKELEEKELLLAAREGEIAVLREENTSLALALGLVRTSETPLIAARVFSYYQSLGRETLIIDAGQERGIGEGDIVIDGHRLLIGQVSAVTPATAVVGVASNKGTVFSGELVPLGGRILLKGLGGRAFGLELIPHDTPLRDGDMVRWVREDRRVIPPVFAGRVVKGVAASGGAFKTGRASLLADPAHADMVFVLASP